MTYPDEKEATGGRRGFEALAVILLSLATVGTAWCSYQASGWGTRSTKLSIQSAGRRHDAASSRIKANQKFMLDVFLFSEYMQAHSASNEPLAGFYVRKFSPELKKAHGAWLRTKPFDEADAPASPFESNFYQPPIQVQADAAEKQSEQLWYESGEAARTAHQYTLISVLLATALFFGGTAPRFETQRKRRIVLVLGLVALLTASGMFLALPRSKEGWSVPPELSPEFIPEGVRP